MEIDITESQPRLPIWEWSIIGSKGKRYNVLHFEGIPYPSLIRRLLIKIVFGWDTTVLMK